MKQSPLNKKHSKKAGMIINQHSIQKKSKQQERKRTEKERSHGTTPHGTRVLKPWEKRFWALLTNASLQTTRCTRYLIIIVII